MIRGERRKPNGPSISDIGDRILEKETYELWRGPELHRPSHVGRRSRIKKCLRGCRRLISIAALVEKTLDSQVIAKDPDTSRSCACLLGNGIDSFSASTNRRK